MLPAVYNPPLVTVPPVAKYVTDGAVVAPLLHRPLTLNCCAPPVASDVEAGVRITCVKVGGGAAVTVTVAESRKLPVSETARTIAVPALAPAVKRPPVVILPDDADQVILTVSVVLSLYRPLALNCCAAPVCTVAALGETVMDWSARGGPSGSVTATLEEQLIEVAATAAITLKFPATLPAV
jgi:hypothetical protein